MKIIGIVCEYNPFHNGHLYHLKKVKELFPDSLIVLVLNGYFMQRGDVSIISKKDKCQIALSFGVDLVIELPFVYGTQSADIFASASVKILESLKCDYIVFGSESNNIDILNKITDYMLNNEEEYNKKVKEYLDNGINYPTAMAKALNIDFEFKSNDLLGISYLKAIKNNNYHIKGITIKRTNDYLDTTSNDDIISATNIRNKWENNQDIKRYLPKYREKYLKKINLDDYFNLIKYKIITEKDLSIYLDVDEGIENRLVKIIDNCTNLDDFIAKIKSKRYTHNKIKRMLVHILIGLTKEDNKKITLDYLKILGFSKKGQEYLNNIKDKLDIPITINKKSLVYIYEIKASKIYDLVTNGDNLKFELSNKPIKF